MYFWKTGQLASEIKNGALAESSKKNYYLATLLIALASMSFVSLETQKNFLFSAMQSFILIVITIVGINITFATNNRNSGNDYVGRVVVLSFPLSIKYILFGYLFGSVFGFFPEIIENSDYWPWVTLLPTALIQSWFFWRLNIHLRYINA